MRSMYKGAITSWMTMSVDLLRVPPSLLVILFNALSILCSLRIRLRPDGRSEDWMNRGKVSILAWIFGFSAASVWFPTLLLMKSPINFLIRPGVSVVSQPVLLASKRSSNGKSNASVPSNSCCRP